MKKLIELIESPIGIFCLMTVLAVMSIYAGYKVGVRIWH